MKALVGGFSQRSANTVSTSSVTAISTEYSRPRTRRRSNRIGVNRPLGRCLHTAGRVDDHVFHRRVGVPLAAAGGDRGDLIDDLQTGDHAAKDRVAMVARAVIEKLVVLEIHEELRGGAVRGIGARHGQRAALIQQAIAGFVPDRWARGLLRKISRQAAALDHEAGHNAVKDGAVEKALLDVLAEIRDGQRRVLVEQFDGEAAVGRFKTYHGDGSSIRVEAAAGHCASVTRGSPARSWWQRT